MAAITNADAPTNVANIVYDLENWQWTWGHVADTAGDVAAVSPLGTLQGITKGGKLVGIALVSGKEIKVITNTAEDAAKVVKNGSKISGNFNKVKDSYLKKKGIDAHELKKDFLGKKAPIAQYDIYVNKDTGELFIFMKGGKGEGIPTGEFIK